MIWTDVIIPANEIRICQRGNYIYIENKSEYDQFVTDLKAKARELWPDKFGKKDFDISDIPAKQTLRAAFERGDDTITAEEARGLDKHNRTTQIPIGSMK